MIKTKGVLIIKKIIVASLIFSCAATIVLLRWDCYNSTERLNAISKVSDKINTSNGITEKTFEVKTTAFSKTNNVEIDSFVQQSDFLELQGNQYGFCWEIERDGITVNYLPEEQAQDYVVSPLDKPYTWRLGFPPDIGTKNYDAIDFIVFYNENNGLIIDRTGAGMSKGYYNIFQTGDGGKTWVVVLSDFSVADYIVDVVYLDVNTILLVSPNGATQSYIQRVDLRSGRITRNFRPCDVFRVPVNHSLVDVETKSITLKEGELYIEFNQRINDEFGNESEIRHICKLDDILNYEYEYIDSYW